MAVAVGSFCDPPEAQGLSHFLEVRACVAAPIERPGVSVGPPADALTFTPPQHMVFMGSERFPDENSYDSYLQQHGARPPLCSTSV